MLHSGSQECSTVMLHYTIPRKNRKSHGNIAQDRLLRLQTGWQTNDSEIKSDFKSEI